MNRKLAYVVCNFNCLIKTEGRLKVTGSHVQCKSGKLVMSGKWYKIETLLQASGSIYGLLNSDNADDLG